MATQPIKRVAALHDLSAFGRCALTVVIPALSAMGVQVLPVPTALLSTHTGGFDDYYFRDMSDSIEPIADHWESLGVRPDSVYTGFLSGEAQCAIIERFIRRFRGTDTLTGFLYRRVRQTHDVECRQSVGDITLRNHAAASDAADGMLLSGALCRK